MSPDPAALALLALGLASPALALLQRLLGPRPGLGLSLAVCLGALALLVVAGRVEEALALVEAARPVQRRALLHAALDEALAPLPWLLALAALALAPHALTARSPASAWLRPGPALALVAAGLLLHALWGARGAWTAWAELGPLLRQLDEPPPRTTTLFAEEAGAALATGASRALRALVTAAVALPLSLAQKSPTWGGGGRASQGSGGTGAPRDASVR